MSFRTPPVVDEKGRIHHIEPTGNIQPDADCDFNDMMFAASHGRINLVELLLELGADVNAKSVMHGSTALMLATGFGHVDVVKVLLDKGANVEGRDGSGRTSLMVAVETSDIEIVKVLLNAGADANVADNWGATPLILAVREGHIGIVKALLNAGVNVNARDNGGYTALSFVPNKRLVRIPYIGEFYSNERNKEMTQLLREAGATM